MVFGEESLVAFLTDKVSAALVRVHVFLQVVGLQEMLVALWALYPAFAVVGVTKNIKATHYICAELASIPTYEMTSLSVDVFRTQRVTYCV